MGLLTGDISRKVYKAFKGRLLQGQIVKNQIPESASTDEFGDVVDFDPTPIACEGFTDKYSDFLRSQGIPDTDLVVNIFAESIPGIKPGKDDRVKFTDRLGIRWYRLRSANIDPASALWVCQAFEIPAPTDV